MTPYRRRLVGLPLQRSLFAGIARAPETIGLAGVLPDDRFHAWVDAQGDLYLDRADVETLGAGIRDRLTPAFLRRMERALSAACTAAGRATERGRASAASLDERSVRAAIGELGEKISALIRLGVLSKFVPDVLGRALSTTTNASDPPFPLESPGAVLTRAAAALYIDCEARGFPAARLRAEWPDVPSDLREVVRDFCAAHVGFGPLQWDAPGYEDPEYVIGALDSTFADDAPQDVLRRLAATVEAREKAGAAARSALETPLRSALAAWVDFLERETWHVRRAFYVGLVPLLRRLVPDYQTRVAGGVPEDVLFLELAELTASPTDCANASARRAAYLSDAAYLTQHAIVPARLRAIVNGG